MTRLHGVPAELAALLQSIVADFPFVLKSNLVGIYLWGSLSCDAFDERCSDVDSIVVTRRDLSDVEFAALEEWLGAAARRNPWTARLDMRFVIDGEFLDKKSRCCGFYSGKLGRHGSDGNAIIWLNIGESGVTLWGREAKLIAPAITASCLDDALLLELSYLRDELAKNVGDRSDRSFRYNSYAVLTACRILYTAQHRRIVAKERAYRWAVGAIPPELRPTARAAWTNRFARRGKTTTDLEQKARDFVRSAEAQARRALVGGR